MLEHQHFAQEYPSGARTLTERCTRYGISRNTGSKWLERSAQDGPRGLLDRSRAPRSCPHETPGGGVTLILAEHQSDGWEARKILKRLRTADPARD